MAEGSLADHGWIRTDDVGSPAAGVGFYARPSTGLRCQIWGVRCEFTTDANVANRRVQWSIGSVLAAGTIYLNVTVQVANTTRWYNLVPGLGREDFASGDNIMMPWDPRLELTNLQYLFIGCNNIQVGDQFDNISWMRMEYIGDYV